MSVLSSPIVRVSVLLCLGACSSSQSRDPADAAASGGSDDGKPGNGSVDGTDDGASSGGQTPGNGAIDAPTVDCEDFEAGTNLNVCTLTYLGGAMDDEAAAIDFAPDGTIVYGGTLQGNDYGKTAVALQGGGSGVIIRLSADGRSVNSVTRLGQAVHDLAVDAQTGNIAVASDQGLSLLSADAQTLLFSEAASENAARVAVGSDHAIAGLVGKSVRVFDPTGVPLGEFEVEGSTINDLTVDGSGKRVIVTGFTQRDGAPCTQLQVPFMRAYAYDGTLAWKAYDFSKDEVGSVDECADTRGLAVSIGRDGKLYYAGESHGGNTIHRREPQDYMAMTAAIVKHDKYTDPYNLNGAAPILFFGRFDLTTGALLAGQFTVARLNDDKGNAVRPKAITADEKGNILVAGASACCIEGAADKTINGEHAAFGGYAGGAYLLIVPADFSERLQWTSVVGPTGGGSEAVAVAAGGGRMAAALSQRYDDKDTTAEPLLTIDAVQAAPGGGKSDGFLAVFRGP